MMRPKHVKFIENVIVAKRAVYEDVYRLREALTKIEQWTSACPCGKLQQRELDQVRILLAANDISLDDVSAHCTKIVTETIGKFAREALKDPDTPPQRP
jgi:hypothetical protein